MTRYLLLGVRASAALVLGALTLAQPVGAQNIKEAAALNTKATQLAKQGKYAQAIAPAQESLAMLEKVRGPDHQDVATASANLGKIYLYLGRYDDAEPLYQRSLTIREKVLGPDHALVGDSAAGLAFLRRGQGRFGEAEPLLKRSLAVTEKALGPDHTEVAAALNNLASFYVSQGRRSEAEPVYIRSLRIDEKVLGPDHPNIALLSNNLAELYRVQDRFSEAEPLYKRSIAISEKAFGPDHPELAIWLNNLAELYVSKERFREAEPLHRRALAIREKSLGARSLDAAASLNNLANVFRETGRISDAEPLLRRSLDILQITYNNDHPQIAYVLANLAGLYFAQSDWFRSAEFYKNATAVLIRRAQRGNIQTGPTTSLAGSGESEINANANYFRNWVKAAYRIAQQDRALEPKLAREMFEVAQWAQSSSAAQALAQMAVRGANGDPRLAQIARERQELASEWQKRDLERFGFAARAADQQDTGKVAANAARLKDIDTRIATIDRQLVKEFPDYAALVTPNPIDVASVQASLRDDEALVFTLATNERKPVAEETFLWVVTKSQVRWARSEVGQEALKREVAALRCGLDYEGTWGKDGKACGELLKVNYTPADRQAGKPLPFDAARSYALYKSLFSEVADLINDKHLLIVPSGALSELPFQVLVAAPPVPGEDLRKIRWLIRDHALSVLPSVSSLRALRRDAKPSHATRPMIGFGNPLLEGPDARYAPLAKLAKAKSACATKLPELVASLAFKGRGIEIMALRGGMADVSQIRSAAPLPETADELCAVAAALLAQPADIYLAGRATETRVKGLSETGELAKYRVLHFATHGALSGQISGNSEPGLILTPPATASETDDGYLTASEIAGLKLDADWVILSACNTAAGGGNGTEALSGLSRAFFFAGARALLVSHWSVNSDATVQLVTNALKLIAGQSTTGRAEALRKAMLNLNSSGSAAQAHPSYWAAFVVVGEGSALR